MVATVPLMAESQAYEKPHAMDFSHIPENFNVLDDPLAENTSLPAFMVSKVRGFLPRAVCHYYKGLTAKKIQY